MHHGLFTFVSGITDRSNPILFLSLLVTSHWQTQQNISLLQTVNLFISVNPVLTSLSLDFNLIR